MEEWVSVLYLFCIWSWRDVSIRNLVAVMSLEQMAFEFTRIESMVVHTLRLAWEISMRITTHVRLKFLKIKLVVVHALRFGTLVSSRTDIQLLIALVIWVELMRCNHRYWSLHSIKLATWAEVRLLDILVAWTKVFPIIAYWCVNTTNMVASSVLLFKDHWTFLHLLMKIWNLSTFMRHPRLLSEYFLFSIVYWSVGAYCLLTTSLGRLVWFFNWLELLLATVIASNWSAWEFWILILGPVLLVGIIEICCVWGTIFYFVEEACLRCHYLIRVILRVLELLVDYLLPLYMHAIP